jgi:hypothetical protein
MNTNFQPVQMTLMGILLISTFVAAVAVAYRKKLLVTWGKVLDKTSATEPVAFSSKKFAAAAADLLPRLIDRPDIPPADQSGYFEEEDDEARYELVDDEDLTLLKTAESIVADIQLEVDHIPSGPDNKDKVCSKIHAILRDMRFLHETEYYDAINSFVAVTVHRDCDLELTKDEIQSLWLAEAA